MTYSQQPAAISARIATLVLMLGMLGAQMPLVAFADEAASSTPTDTIIPAASDSTSSPLVALPSVEGMTTPEALATTTAPDTSASTVVAPLALPLSLSAFAPLATPATSTSATVVVTNIVCDDESSLPNWGAGGHTMSSTTASAFLKTHTGCHGQSGFSFEWADQSGGNPGDAYIGTAGAPYTTFGPTPGNGVVSTTIPLAGISEIHMREVLKAGYVPFAQNTVPATNVSAEFYCANDAAGYDNLDYIRNPQAGETYNCVAFNAPAVSHVTVCKVSDAAGTPAVPGANVTLKGSKIEDVTVPAASATGIDSANTFSGGSSYLAIALGTWLNQGGANPADAEYSTTDGWATHTDGFTGFSNDILDLSINNSFGNWGPYNSGHSYAQAFTATTSARAHFSIFDGTVDGAGVHTANPSWYADNSGSLAVSLYHGTAGITGSDGCVTFPRVKFGTYTLGETAQDGWTPVSGAGSVVVDSATEHFTLVGHQSTTTPPVIVPPTTTASTTVVRASDLYSGTVLGALTSGKWLMYNDTTDTVDNTLGSFVTGPSTAPRGTGSVAFTLGASPLDRMNIATFQFQGTNLSAISALGFSAFSHSGTSTSPTESPYLTFNVDFASTSAFQGRLVYVPSANGAVAQNTWNTYDALASGTAEWTWSRYFSNGSKWPDGNTNQYRTWADITATWPQAKILANGGFVGVRVGNPGPTDYRSDVDAFVFGTQSSSTVHTDTYDFEPTADIATTTDTGTTTATTTTTAFTPQSTTSGARSGSRSITGSVLGASTSNVGGEVLGASTTTEPSCTPLITTYLKAGAKNDAGEVSKLQAFLNQDLGIALPVTGVFGPVTRGAVATFQKKYADDVLKPWAPFGGVLESGTGYVYKTTQRKINLLNCSTLDIPMPDVSQG